MTEQIIFTMTAVNNIGKVSFRGPDGGEIGEASSIAAVLTRIAETTPLDAQINFQWSDVPHVSFEPMSLEGWLKATQAVRGVSRSERDGEIERLRSRVNH